MREKLQKLCETYKMELQENVPLSEHTTFRIGGNADFWAEINSAEAVAALIRLCRENGYSYFILGKGSNILASDDGYRGLILHLGNAFSKIAWEDPHTMTCQAGAALAKAARIAEESGRSGMEGLSGIPGTVGGALYMNAGAYGYEMKDIVSSCTYTDENGDIQTHRAENLKFSHRLSWFSEHPECVILTVTMKLKEDSKDEITARMQEFLRRRSDKQPLNYPSAGSTFKRPEGNYASALIDKCGLKGYTVGGAQVSEKHAGFVINYNGATCRDVLRLCEDVRCIVRDETGYMLELEPVILGNQTGDESECN